MKVYFTTSSEGVNENKELCRKIVRQIEYLGHELALDWIKLATDESEPLKGHPAEPKKIFEENINSLLEADVAIFEVSSISLGLGYQISHAVAKNIPTLCLYKESTNPSELSNFLLGIDADIFTIEEYSEETLSEILEDYLNEQEKKSLAKFNFIATKEIKDYIEWRASKENKSQSQFLRDLLTKEIVRKDKEYTEERSIN